VQADHPDRDGKEFELASDMETLCFDCHDAPDENLMSHSPFTDGECVACHSPHSSDNPSLLKAESLDELCAACHSIDNMENTFKHGPVISGQCNICHSPHQSAIASLLKEESPKLCFNCHTDNEEMLKLTTVHAAYEGSCLDCHVPHNSKDDYLIKTDIKTLCIDCHDDIGSDMNTAKTTHKIIDQGKSCVECHLPHATQTKALLVQEGNALCYSCHNKEYKSKGRTLKNIDKIVTKSKYNHEAVYNGECTQCHFTHTSNNFYLLNGKFPFGSYAEGATSEHFDQCFSCHDSDALNLEKTTTTTNFRDGDINQHYLHISKNKGRNCTLCHCIHGSNKPHLIAKTVPYGKWQMPLRYKKTENGGSCAPGCHALYK
jgi:predicted CXXCH cytochrome family protein